MSISYSIPTYLSNFTTSVEGRTTAKLKVFYVGETGDGRVFSKEFSEKLIKSLPNCPVVGFFSDLKDDFCGHNSTQYIYGIVPADAEYSFENEEGVEWFVTEVLLYTDRIDNIGEVAQKIVGHPHSLEMHPETTKYEIKIENGKRKIHFVDGSLIGLSVLGMQEKPAFKGSEFFKESTEELREKFESFISFLENKDRGASMNKEQFEKLYSFITLSYEERQSSLHKAANILVGDNAYAYISQCYDDYCVIEVIDWCNGGNIVYKKASYSIDENNQVTFGDIVEVFPRFITKDEIDSLESTNEVFVSEEKEEKEEKCNEEEPKVEEEENEEDFVKEEKPVESEEEEKDPKEEEEEFKEDKEPEQNEEPAQDEEEEESEEDKEDEFNQNNVNGTSEGELNEPQPTFEEEPKQEQESTSNFTALSNSEREELETLRANQVELEQFRLEKRMNLVESYAEELPADTISAFRELAQTCNYDELEAKLAIEFVKVSKNNKKQNTVAFSFGGVSFGNTTVTSTNSYEDLVKRYTNK